MKGILVINNFLESKKFFGIYSMLELSAKKEGIELSVMKSGDILHNIDFVKRLDCDFVLFWDKDVLLAKMLETYEVDEATAKAGLDQFLKTARDADLIEE